jgi:tetratricopeptide (TPR) repeat protein
MFSDDLLPFSQSILNHLDINSDTLKHNQLSHWQKVQYRAVINWLAKYQLSPDASNLEQVRGYLEAFHHLCEIEAWEKASKLLMVPLNTPANKELHDQLRIWSYYQEQIQLYKRLPLNQLHPHIHLICLRGLGLAHRALGNYSQAIAYHQQHLALAQEIGDRTHEGMALGNLGNVYCAVGNYTEGMKYHQQHLTVARKIGDRHGEGLALGHLGSVCYSQGNYQQAIDYYQQDLAIAREVGDRHGEGATLCNLGNVYQEIGDYDQALEHYQQDLAIGVFRI